MALLGLFAYRERARTPGEESTPTSAIWRMLDAARAQDPERYLGCYTDEMERSLRQNLQDMGPARFRDYLARSQRQLKGIAVSPPQTISADERRLSIEYVYGDRNEVQPVYLRRVGKDWKIFRVEGAERVKTLVPYGTPVTE
jgi:hypothetical protein